MGLAVLSLCYVQSLVYPGCDSAHSSSVTRMHGGGLTLCPAPRRLTTSTAPGQVRQVLVSQRAVDLYRLGARRWDGVDAAILFGRTPRRPGAPSGDVSVVRPEPVARARAPRVRSGPGKNSPRRGVGLTAQREMSGPGRVSES